MVHTALEYTSDGPGTTRVLGAASTVVQLVVVRLESVRSLSKRTPYHPLGSLDLSAASRASAS